jgi:hypothetical protein
MNKIDDKELFRHLSGFFKSKGIELKAGVYTQGIQKGCELLADTVNLSQEAMERAKAQMERQVEQMRQIIHERTAPKRNSSRASRRKSSGAKTRPAKAKGRK